jgi:membrane protease YdiL (CAAX protease family)
MGSSLVVYFVLAYALSWCAFIPVALTAQGVLDGVPEALHVAGAFGPLLAAFIVTGVTAGGTGLRELLGRMARWRIGLGWLLVALFSPVALYLVAALILRVFSGSWPEWSQFGAIAELPQLGWLGGWCAWILTFGLGEETGWRGFALPRLQKDHSARGASLIVGLLWAGWHIPTFFYNYEPSVFGVLAFLVGILSGSALLTWLYNSTAGSVFAAILWHGTYNAAVSAAEPGISALVTAFVILAVIIIANRFGPETLSHRERQILG